MKTLLIALAFGLCLVGCGLTIDPGPGGSCECHAYGLTDYYGNFPYGIGYGYSATEACYNAEMNCAAAAWNVSYLPSEDLGDVVYQAGGKTYVLGLVLSHLELDEIQDEGCVATNYSCY